jgi:hypothetical protein
MTHLKPAGLASSIHSLSQFWQWHHNKKSCCLQNKGCLVIFKAIAACVLSKNICLVHVQLRYLDLSAENIYQFRLYNQAI